MICKCVEIRDSGTFIPALAVKLEADNEVDRYLIRRAGFGGEMSYVMLADLDGGTQRAHTDPFDWPMNPRTMHQAHLWLIAHFDEIEPGAVIDVEYELGLTNMKKRSERYEQY